MRERLDRACCDSNQSNLSGAAIESEPVCTKRCEADAQRRPLPRTMAYYDKMAAMALKQDERIAELEAENTKLKEEVASLKQQLGRPVENGEISKQLSTKSISDEMSVTPHAMSSAI